MMKREIDIFFTAVMFYTRIPCPKNISHDPDYLNRATRYFPLIGWIVGLISFGAFYLGMWLGWGGYLAIIFSLAAGIWTTGAFHEDGLADVCDGFGGGWTKEKILTIMKDSRVGTYGVVGLLLVLLGKVFALRAMVPLLVDYPLVGLLLFVNYHTLARLAAVNIVFTSEYAREDETSKAKPIAKSYSAKEVFWAYFLGLIPLVILAFVQWEFALVLLPLALLVTYLRYYYNKWLGGYTGDCLGAAEQFGELLVLLVFLSL